MLLANLAKSPSILKLLALRCDAPKSLTKSQFAIDQLLDCFVKGAEGSYNERADYDYLSYLFADLARHEAGREHFLSPRGEDDDIIPIAKLIVFTEHKSTIRRRGIANAIKNVAFDVPSHSRLLASDGICALPYILLPLMGNEEYSEEDTEGMLDECQLLAPDKIREQQNDILITHLETLLILTTGAKMNRQRMRDVKIYPIIRELHLHMPDDSVREACDRLVQVLMRQEEGEEDDGEPKVREVKEDEDCQIVDVL